MKNLRFNKMSLMGKYSRLSVLLCMLLVSITGSAGNYFYYQYNVTVAPNSSNTGLGKVYLDATANSYYENGTLWSETLKDNEKIDDFKESTTLTLLVSQKNENASNKKFPQIEYTSVTLRAEALDGSIFTGWTWNNGSSTDATISITDLPDRRQMQGDGKSSDTTTAICPNAYIAHFTARTYYYQSPGANATGGAMVYVSTDGVRPDDSSNMWKTNIPTGSPQSKSADGNGQYAYATVTYYLHAKAPDGYYDLIGWYDQNGTEVLLGENGRYDLRATSENAAAPTTIVLTPKFVPTNPYTTLTKDNLHQVELYTGVEGTKDIFPYSPKKRIDLSKIFGTDNKALFDSLYIFGETVSADGQPLVNIMGSRSPNTAANTPIPNAITPCYVYIRSDEKTYTLQRTIQNMNPKSTVKPIPDITADGQKLYFTGYCPYASNGVTTQIGVFHIKGGAGKKVDVYLDDLYLYARFHTSNGWGYFPVEGGETLGLSAGVGSDKFIPVSASPFVFSSTSTNKSYPFTPAIHICDSNKLEGGTGHIRETLSKQNAGIYSAPIHLYVTATNQVTSLTIDDEWPISTTEKVRTNGKLNLISTNLGRPSIELGNDNSTLNINGGQLYIKNAIPCSGSYKSTFAIGRRTYKKEVMGITGMLSGMGEDQPGGNVNFNDGTIYCVPITEKDMNAYPGCYRNTSSMKCPRNTKINGGSLMCDIWACDGAQSIGASPTNQYGDSLVSVRLKINNTPTSPYYIATVDFESLAMNLICRDESNTTYYGKSLATYYSDKGGTYNRASLKADATDSVTFMLPYYFTDKTIYGDEALIDWAIAIPSLKVNSGTILGTLSFGGQEEVKSSSTQSTRYLLFTELGSSAMSAVGQGAGYKTPAVGEIPSYEAWVVEDSYYSDIENEEAYTIQDAQYLVKPIEAADEWMLFSPPFDVTNVYVLETFPEDSLKKVPLLYDAYKIQTQSVMDFAFYYAYYIEYMQTTYSFWKIYDYWRKDPNLTKGPGRVQLTHFMGNNYDANYYLQRSSGDWDWDETEQKFTTDWQFVTPEKVTHGDKQYDVIMKKGEIYSMKFPYMYYGYSQKTGEWDYWTGKYLIFEGLGTQTIEGKNYHNSIRNVLPAPSKAAVRVNSTFAKMTPNDDAYVLSQDMETGYQKFTAPNSEDPVVIEPTSGYVMVDHTIPAMSMPGRKAAIDMMSGTVTYEEDDDDFSTPTIAGEHTLLVYTTPDGLDIMPVVPQQVAIYNAAGQLVTKQFMSTETHVTLPAGIYFISGETERVKAMVK